MTCTVTSNLNSAVVWVNLVSSLIRKIVKWCRLLFILLMVKKYFRSCLGWISNWLWSLSWEWLRSIVGGLEISASESHENSTILLALGEKTDYLTPKNECILGMDQQWKKFLSHRKIFMKAEYQRDRKQDLQK